MPPSPSSLCQVAVPVKLHAMKLRYYMFVVVLRYMFVVVVAHRIPRIGLRESGRAASGTIGRQPRVQGVWLSALGP